MNSTVNPVVAVIVVALALACSGIWMWGAGRLYGLGGPARILLDPDGHLFIQAGNQLLEHDENGKFIVRHDLGRLGVETVLGDIAFFSNGELLLRRGKDPRSVLDNIRAFFRQTNRHDRRPDHDDAGLYRCSLTNLSCTPFGRPAIDFKATYRVFIDLDTDDAYFSDTSRHLLHKYSADGVAIADPVSGFKFPNDLALFGDTLLIADTNHHSIRAVDSRSASFGRHKDVFQVTPSATQRGGHQWPADFIRISDEWWVLNMTPTMNFGGVYVFDSNWQYRRQLALPENADPVSMQHLGSDVLISDWYNYRVHRFSAAGMPLPEFTSPGLEQYYAESRNARLRYQMLTWSSIGILAVLTLILLIKGTMPPQSPEPPGNISA